MKFQTSKKSVALVLVIAFAFASFSCQKIQTSANQTAVNGEATVKAQTPTEAYTLLFAAVKEKNRGKVEQLLSKNTLALAGAAAKQYNHSMEKQLENGLLETTMTDSLPPIRDERIKDNFGAIEVFNRKTNQWDDTAFVFEDGGWKLAVGDQFKGDYKSPGKGQAQLEMEASNSAGNGMNQPAVGGGKFPTNKNENVKTVEVPIENSNKTPAGKEKK